MQSYTEIASSTTLTSSLGQILNNDKSIMSDFSGTAFPTTNLQVGMRCLRTDQNKLYRLDSIGPDTWVMLIDYVKTIAYTTDTQACVQKAGDTMTGALNLNWQQAQNALLKSYREVATTANTTATYSVDCAASNVHNLTLVVAATTISFANIPAAGVSFGVTLILKQDAAGSRTVTWPAGVKWAGGTAPVLTTTANKIDVISLTTLDGGATWLGFVGGKNF